MAAPTVAGSWYTAESTGSASGSATRAASGSSQAAVAIVAAKLGSGSLPSSGTTVSYGNVPLVAVAGVAASFVNTVGSANGRRVQAYFLDDISGRADDVFRWTTGTGGTTVFLLAMAVLDHANELVVIDTDTYVIDGGGGTGATDSDVDLDSGSFDSLGIVASVCDNTMTEKSGQTNRATSTLAGAVGHIRISTEDVTGAQTLGHNRSFSSGPWVAGGLLVGSVRITIAQDPMVVVVRMGTQITTAPATIIRQDPMVIDISMGEQAVTAYMPMQVQLAGGKPAVIGRAKYNESPTAFDVLQDFKHVNKPPRMVDVRTLVSGGGDPGPPGPIGPPGYDGSDGSDGTPGAPGPKGDAGTPGAAGPGGAIGPPGYDGADGAEGQPGAPGPIGLPGTPGAAGPIGTIGPPGYDGSDGVDGLPGAPGPKGDTGASGFTGNMGPIGPPGYDGADGEDGLLMPGPMGPAGTAGATGVPGPQGATGPLGPPGYDGADGEDGVPIPGPMGPAGATGSPGSTGLPGSAGASGPIGPPGYDGSDGEDGLPGPMGPAGAQGAPGSTGPAGGTGAPGPIGPPGYDGEDGDAGDPGAMGPMGPAGTTGSTGPSGPTGAGGPIGPPGYAGDDGEDGVPGPMGPAGAMGPAGSTGVTGPSGPTGDAGPIGPPGYDGSDGDDGLPGPAGAPGAAGATGSTGSTGPTGPAGPIGAGIPGPPGDDGEDGVPLPGPMGPAGAAGATGGTGPAGAMGPMGSIGYAGEDGDDGPMGPPGPGSAGVTDHGLLAGLADDDHPQYTTAAEATTIADAEITTHEGLANPHPSYETAAEVLAQITTHAGLADPHTGYRLESADHSHASTGLQAGTVAHSVLTGQTATDHHAAPVAGPDANVTVDAAGAAGTASTFARSAHGHQVVTTDAPSGANVTVDAAATAAATGAIARAAHGHRLNTYASTPAPTGTAAAGTSGTAPSRGDHVHALEVHDVDEHKGYQVTRSVSADTFTKIASGSMSAANHNWSVAFLVTTDLAPPNAMLGLVYINDGVSGAPTANVELRNLYSSSGSPWREGDLIVVFTSVSLFAISFELYLKFPAGSMRCEVTPLTLLNNGTTYTWHESQSLVGSLPGGTQVAATRLRWEENTSGHLVPRVDSTYDIGLAATRVRNVYSDQDLAATPTLGINIANTSAVTLATKTIEALAVGDQVFVDARFLLVNNSGGVRTYTLEFNFSSLALLVTFTSAASLAAGVDSYWFHMEAVFTIISTSAARAHAEIHQGVAAAAAGATAALSTANMLHNYAWATSASNLTGDRTVALTSKSNNATGTQTADLLAYRVERVRP